MTTDEFDFLDFTLTPYPCTCPRRSRVLPARLSVLTNFGGKNDEPVDLHWAGDGWVPCVNDPAEYDTLYGLSLDLKVPVPEWTTFEQAGHAAAVAANRLDRDWQAELTQALLHLDANEQISQQRAVARLADVNDRRHQLALRIAVSRVTDPQLAEQANRMLEAGFAGTADQLLASAAAVLA